MILVALLAAATPAPPPEREMLDAFKAACSRTGNDIEAMKADAAASGWTAMPDDGDARIARLVKLGRDAAEADGKVAGANFRRTLGGRDIFLIVSRYEDKSGFWGAGCRLYDFEATAPLDGPALEKPGWASRRPPSRRPRPACRNGSGSPAGATASRSKSSHVAQGHPARTAIRPQRQHPRRPGHRRLLNVDPRQYVDQGDHPGDDR